MEIKLKFQREGKNRKHEETNTDLSSLLAIRGQRRRPNHSLIDHCNFNSSQNNANTQIYDLRHTLSSNRLAETSAIKTAHYVGGNRHLQLAHLARQALTRKARPTETTPQRHRDSRVSPTANPPEFCS